MLAFVTLSHSVAFARLGYTREQAEANYGPAIITGTPESATPLIDGAQELTFEHQGWVIRCALLLATDGNQYVVREEYTNWRNGESPDERHLAIEDYERNDIFQMESGQRVWAERTVADDLAGFSPEFGAKLIELAGVKGKLWRGPGERIARMPTGNKSLILELPQALKHETEFRKLKERSTAEADQAELPRPSSPEPLQEESEQQPQGKATDWFAVQCAVVLLGMGLAAWFSPVTRKLLLKWRKAPRFREASSVTQEAEPEAPPPMKPRDFRTLAWDEFEILVGEIYRVQRYTVAINNASGADGGIDLVLTREDERVLVQCKNWNGTKVTAKEIREFFGVIISECATRGIFVTSSSFTRDAREFAAGKPLELIDGKKLLDLVDQTQKTSVVDLFDVSQWAPLFALSVERTTPPCPFCRSKMVLRNSSRGKFWGCSTFPRCRGKRDARRYLVSGVK